MDSTGRRQSRDRPHLWPARYRAGIASNSVLTHGVLFRDKFASESQGLDIEIYLVHFLHPAPVLGLHRLLGAEDKPRVDKTEGETVVAFY